MRQCINLGDTGGGQSKLLMSYICDDSFHPTFKGKRNNKEGQFRGDDDRDPERNGEK